jgi:hypothetical protein
MACTTVRAGGAGMAETHSEDFLHRRNSMSDDNQDARKRFPAVKTLYRLRPTGRTRQLESEFGKPIDLPEVELMETDLSVPELDSYSAVSRVEGDPAAYYLVSDQWYSDPEAFGGLATLLVRTHHALDAGDNLVRRRVAPQTLTGITAPFPGSGELTSHHGKPTYAVKPDRRDTSKATSGHNAIILRIAEAK